MKSQKETVFETAESLFGSNPEYLWAKYPTYAVLRHPNKKWYAAVMKIPRSKIGLGGDGDVDVINVKVNPLEIGSLLLQSGIFLAYHMNKSNWITVLLDGSVDIEQIKFLLRASYMLVGSKTKNKRGN